MPITHEWNGTILTITSDSGTSSADLRGATGATGARGARGLTGATGGGALIEDGVISSDTTWSSAGIMDRFAEQLATTGNPVSCNPIPDFPLHVITSIEPTQDGSGNPYPAGGGRNLLNYDLWKTVKINDGTAVWQDNGVILTANNTDCYTRYAASDFPCAIAVNTGDTIIMSWEHSGADGLVYIFGNGSTSSMTNVYSSVKTLKYVVPNGITFITIRLGVQGAGNTAIYKNVQVEKGTAVTAFQPYENIRPIRTMEAVKVTRCGKNLAKSIYATGYTSVYSNCLYVDADIMPNTTYTISFVANAENANRVLYLNELITAYKDFRITGTRQSITFTTKETISNTPIAGKGYIMFKNGTELAAPMTFTDVQLEQGETATNFEAYKGNTYTIDLGGKYAQGVLDWNTGEFIVDKKGITFDGNENWTQGATAQNNKYRWGISIAEKSHSIPTSEIPNIISSHYKAISANNTYIAYNGITVNVDVVYIYDEAQAQKTLNEWKAYLAAQNAAGKPVQVCYELDEPITIQLTPQEIKAISGINNLYTDANEIKVAGRVDTMYQLYLLEQRIAALEAKA